MAGVNIPGLCGLIFFYVLILAVGIGAAWWKTRKAGPGADKAKGVMVAGRDIGLFVGIFTMTATWVGGGYINGTAEYVFTYGLLHAQAPIGYSISLFLSGLFFAKQFRERHYLTMLDPFQEKYGVAVGALLYLPALAGELFWSASILNALGSSVSVIIDLPLWISILVSAFIAVLYTFFGGLYSVAYTDVLQLICIPLGLGLAIPFAWYHPAVEMDSDIFEPLNGNTTWIGSISPSQIGSYVDSFLLLIGGGIPWQVYFQRVLSARTAMGARILSFAGGIGCLLMSIPPAIIGVIAKRTNWTATDYGPIPEGEASLVLPLTIQYLTPPAVTFCALGAISAAVMSSSDSSILSASSMFAQNIYRSVFRPHASGSEIVWVLRAAVVVCGAIATAIALVVQSVYSLFYLCGDVVYVILLPQLVLVMYFPISNSYGCLLGFLVGLVFRILAGEPAFHLDQIIPYSGNVPYKTIVMLLNFVVSLTASVCFKLLFERHILPQQMDILHAFNWSDGRLSDRIIRPVQNIEEKSPGWEENNSVELRRITKT